MLWERYIFRRGPEVHELWEDMFQSDPIKLLYISGRGFDVRAQATTRALVAALRPRQRHILGAEMLLVSFPGYELSDELRNETARNAEAIEQIFSVLGATSIVPIQSSAGGEDDISTSNALRLGTAAVVERITDHTHVILDVSSLPRVAYLSVMFGILEHLVPDVNAVDALTANGVNFQILVAEDAVLDSKIQSEDPSNDLVLIPGFATALQIESVQDWPLVWFPILGENRVPQFSKVLAEVIPNNAEVCPVVPHPSRDPRRADRLLVEYREALFDTKSTPTSNILYVHESHPFEAYRQLLRAMERYRDSLQILGGCRLVVTPLGSKLITVGAGLACFEMRPSSELDQHYGVAIPYAEPRRYSASSDALHQSRPDISTLLLTGQAYDPKL